MSARQRLLDAWAALVDGGHVVRRVDLDGLEDHEIAALAEEAEHRLKVIGKASDDGWVPSEQRPTTRRCVRCDEPKALDEMSWRAGWCKACEAARVRGYLDRDRTQLGDEEFKARRARAQRDRRQRLRRAT